MKEKKNRVSFNDVQTFKKADKLDALKKDPNSDYNSFINKNPNEPNPSDSGNSIKN